MTATHSPDDVFDVVIIGGGPVGCELARLASGLGKSVALVEATREGQPLAAPTGWISKALRHGALELGTADGSVRVPWEQIDAEYVQPTVERALTMTREMMRPSKSMRSSILLTAQDDRNTSAGNISFLEGNAAFVGPHRLSLKCKKAVETFVSGETVFLATGSVGTRIPVLPWEDKRFHGWLYDSHTIQNIGRLPEHIVIQGGGVIGVEYAFILRRLGSNVTVVLREESLIDGKGVDSDIKAAVARRLLDIGVQIHFGDGDITEVSPPLSPGGKGSVLLTQSGKKIECDTLASMVGRSGTARSLELPLGGLPPPTRSGHISVVPTTMRVRPKTSSFVQAPRVWAAGDVVYNSAISPLGLLSTGIAQAHLAIQSAFADEWSEFVAVQGIGGGGRVLGNVGFDALPPSAIWIEDGVGMVGLSEHQVEKAVPTGDWSKVTVYFNETIKSCVEPRPDDEMLKLIFQISTGRIIGVHIFGADAAEMIHHASSLVNNPLENTVWHVIKSVPPALTYSEVLMKACYRAVDCIHASTNSGTIHN